MRTTSDRFRVRRQRSAFTLIELLVVIGILVMLMAILLAAVSGRRPPAIRQRTTAMLAGLSTSISAYIQDWSDCPGPIAESDIAAAPGQFTGSQNMYLGLAERWGTTSAGLAQPYQGLGVNGHNVYAETGPASQPVDSNGKPYGPYFAAKTSETAMPAALGMTKLEAFPIVLDRYSDPLPILYYRGTPGVGSATGSHQTMVTMAAPSGANVASFYLNSNVAITSNPALKSPSGAVYPQNLRLADLDKMLGTLHGSVELPKGRFVLISAGYDRTYAPAADGTTDNIIVAGGN